MPIDPSIATQTRLPQPGRSPFHTLGALAQLDQQRQIGQQRELINEQRRRALEDDDAIRTTLARTGNPDDAIEELYQSGRPAAAGALGKQIYDWRKTKAEQIKLETSNAHEKLKLATQIAQGITDQGSFDMGRRAINALLTPVLGQDITEQFGTEYDPERIKQLVAWGTERGDFLKQQQDAIDNANKAIELGRKMNEDIDNRAKHRQEADAYWAKAAAGYLSTARSQEQWDAFSRMLVMGGASPTTIARFGNEYSPEAVARAQKLGLTPKEAADIAHQKVTESQGQQNINLREREIKERESASGDVTARGRSLTANRKSEIETGRKKAYGALEDELRTRFSSMDPEKAGNLEIPDEAQPEIAQRKLQIEDAYRAEMGQPPLAQAEFELARDPVTNAKALQKIRNTYRGLTRSDAPLERLEKLRKQVAHEKDPAKAAALKQQLRELTTEYMQSIGQ